MFTSCSNITEIDLSNFDSSRVTNMSSMFSDCTSLISINFTNFITSQVEQMDYMFYECSSLISLNLSSFDTSKVTDMNCMFSRCLSLSSLDLSNFRTPKVKSIIFMFYYSPNLEYINLNNFITSSLEKVNHCAFSLISENPVVCINEKDDFLISLLQEDINCYTIDCSNDWKSKQKKKMNNDCVESCNISKTYEYNGICLEGCSNGYFIENDIKKCKCELDKCLTCPQVALDKNLCTSCDDGFYQKENDPSNLGYYFDCYNEEPEGYYLDEELKCIKNLIIVAKLVKEKEIILNIIIV